MDKRYIIFGRSDCPFCVMAVDYCKARNKEHVFLDYNKFPEILEDYKEFYNSSTVPIILENELASGYTKKVGGYTDLLSHE